MNKKRDFNRYKISDVQYNGVFVNYHLKEILFDQGSKADRVDYESLSFDERKNVEVSMMLTTELFERGKQVYFRLNGRAVQLIFKNGTTLTMPFTGGVEWACEGGFRREKIDRLLAKIRRDANRYFRG